MNRTLLHLEALEARDNPAGTVTATLVGTTWTIVGDTDANTIQINPGPDAGEFFLTGTNTVVAGATEIRTVRNIVVRMGGGNDSVTVNDTATRAVLAGSLTVDGGDGANSLRVEQLAVGKNLTVVNGDNAVAGTDVFTLTDSDVGGKVAVMNGDGNTRTTIARSTPGVSTIGRGLSLTAGTGRDDVQFLDTHVGGNVAIDLGLPNDSDIPGSVFFLNQENLTARSLIAGSLKVKVGGGVGGAAAFVALTDYEVAGNVRIDHQAAGGTVLLDARNVPQPVLVRGSVSVTTRGGDISFGSSVSGPGDGTNNRGLTVGKNLTVDTGAAAAKVVLFRATIGGKTSIVTGGEADTLEVDDSSFGAFKLLTNGGADRVSWELRDPDIAGLFPINLVTRFNGKTKVDLGLGADTLLLGVADEPRNRVEFLGPATLLGGEGTDALGQDNEGSPLGTPKTIDFELKE